MCVIYVQTRTLLISVAILLLNNGLLWFLLPLGSDHAGHTPNYTLGDIQRLWPLGLVALPIGIPWAIVFLRRNTMSKNASVPIAEWPA